MHCLRLLLASLLLLFVIAGCGDDDAAPSANSMRIESSNGIVEIQRSPFRLRVHSRTDSTVSAVEAGAYYERSGQRIEVGDVATDAAIEAGRRFTVATSEGTHAEIEIRFLTPRTVSVIVQPEMLDSVTAIGDRFESPPAEAIY